MNRRNRRSRRWWISSFRGRGDERACRAGPMSAQTVDMIAGRSRRTFSLSDTIPRRASTAVARSWHTPTPRTPDVRSSRGARMILLNPKQHRRPYSDARSAEVMRTTIDFFESKGKTKLLADYYDRVWYADFLDFVKANR